MGLWVQWPGGPVDLKSYWPPKKLTGPPKNELVPGLCSNALAFANASANAAFAFALDSFAADAFALAFAFDSSAFAFALAFDSNAFD